VPGGLLIAFEGLDQSGKQTQAERLRDHLIEKGRRVRLISFPDYRTPIGHEIGLALYITENTVKTHLASLYRKLGVERKSAALRVARELGLL